MTLAISQVRASPQGEGLNDGFASCWPIWIRDVTLGMQRQFHHLFFKGIWPFDD